MVLINYFFMCLIFGTTFLAIKIGVDAGMPPFLSAGLRFFIAVYCYLVLWFGEKERQYGCYFVKRCFLQEWA